MFCRWSLSQPCFCSMSRTSSSFQQPRILPMTMVLVSSWLLLLFGFSSGALESSRYTWQIFKGCQKKNCRKNPLFGVNGCKAQSGGSETNPQKYCLLAHSRFSPVSMHWICNRIFELDNSRSFLLVVKLCWRRSHSKFVDCKDLGLFQGAYLVWKRQVQFSDSFRYLWKAAAAAAAVVMVLRPIWCILGCREWGWIFCLVWSHHEQQQQTEEIQATSFTLQVSLSVLKPILRFFSSLLSLSLSLSLISLMYSFDMI